MSKAGRASRLNTKQDGGYAWVILIASFFLCMLKGAQIANLGYFIVKFLTHYNLTKFEVSTIAALNQVLGNLLACVAGMLVRRFGCRPTAALSTILASCGYIITAFFHSLAVVYVFFGVVAGIGFLGGYMCALISCQQYFRKRLALATSLCATGLGIGLLIFPPISYLLDKWYGWRGALLIEGAITLQGVVAAALLRPFEEHGSGGGARPLLASLCPFTDLCTIKATEQGEDPRRSFTRFYVYLAGTFMLSLGHITLVIYTPLRAKLLGFSSAQGALLVSVVGFLALSRFLFGWIGDRKWVDRSTMMSVFALCGGLFLLLSTATTRYLHLAIIQGFSGIAAAGYMALQAAVLVDTVDLPNVTMANAALNTIHGIAGTVTNMVAGALIDVTGEANAPFWLFGICQLLSAIFFAAVTILHKKHSANELDPNSLL